MKTENEEELLSRGNQIKTAIDSYFISGGSYPESLDALLYDDRIFTFKKHLRRLYNDPITGKRWDIITDKSDKIVGVRSKSNMEPLKKTNFPEEYRSFEGKTKYYEWEFKSRVGNEMPRSSFD
jgi:type II secretory pathway pseudopilin PulG